MSKPALEIAMPNQVFAVAILFLIFSWPLSSCSFAQMAKQDEDRKPNIIYIMLDDAGYADFGAFGSPDILTPTFDQMCREGTRFTHHYSGSAVCAPTRCVLMTGLDSGHCVRRDNTAKTNLKEFSGRPLVFLEPDDLTVAEKMQEAGYVTGGIGKWGLGNSGTDGSPDKQGFDHFFGYLDQVHAHEHYPDWLWKNGERMELPKNANGKMGTYAHDLFETDTLNFIRGNAKKPFFLYLCYTLPHGKYEIPQSDPACKLYEDKNWKQPTKNYAAMITRADRTVGKIYELLAELEIDENTIVFYTSDNGPNQQFVKPLKSNVPFRGTKRQLTEGGLRAAMAVRWPRNVPANATSDFAWTMADVFPTACELAGVDAPDNLSGMSVVPTLLGQKQEPHEYIYWEIHSPFQQAVRTDRWKAIRLGTKERLYLYDVFKDPTESNDLSEKNPKIVDRIEKYLETARVESRYFPALEKAKPKKSKSKKK